jgi:carboxypeptidase C (cathepsin A)
MSMYHGYKVKATKTCKQSKSIEKIYFITAYLNTQIRQTIQTNCLQVFVIHNFQSYFERQKYYSKLFTQQSMKELIFGRFKWICNVD